MNIFRNVAGQGVYLYAYTISTGVAKTSDAANITGSYSLDGTDHSGFGTAHPTEMGGGVYWQPLAQGETDGHAIAYRWSSSTSGVNILPLLLATSVQLADGVAHGGTPGSSTATLAAANFQVVNPAGNAVLFQSTGGDGIGLTCVGYGAGNGGVFQGGNDAGSTGAGLGLYSAGPQPALDCEADASTGDERSVGIYATGVVGMNVYAAGVAGFAGLKLQSNSGDAVKITPGSGRLPISAPLVEPTGAATDWWTAVCQFYRRFFPTGLGKVQKTASDHSIKTYASDGTTVVTTQTWSDDGSGNQTLNAAS